MYIGSFNEKSPFVFNLIFFFYETRIDTYTYLDFCGKMKDKVEFSKRISV